MLCCSFFVVILRVEVLFIRLLRSAVVQSISACSLKAVPKAVLRGRERTETHTAVLLGALVVPAYVPGKMWI